MLIFADAIDFFKSGSWETVVTVIVAICAVGAPMFPIVWKLAGRVFRKELETLTKENLELKGRLDDTKAHLGSLQRDLDMKRTELQVLQTRYDPAQSQLGIAQLELKQAVADLERIRGERQQVFNRWERAATEIKQLQTLLETTKTSEKKYYEAAVDREKRWKKSDTDLNIEKLRSEEQTKRAELLKAELDSTANDLVDRQRALLDSENRIREVLNHDGFLWTAKAHRPVPPFLPQAERKQTIISVLNLKGGVGKTTLTANLGVALARKGCRVLFLDMDLQGTLTSLLVKFDDVERLRHDKLLMQDFLIEVAKEGKPSVPPYLQEVGTAFESAGSIHVLPTTDTLGYTEMSLTTAWLLKQGEHDERFLLREAFHDPEIAEKFDVVFIDCPPLINMSCINALSASDYILVPATLDHHAIERVPALLRRILKSDEFRANINPHLKVLGLVANRTYSEDLSNEEKETWEKLGVVCSDALRSPVKRFKPAIPRWNEVRDSKDILSPNADQNKATKVFAALAAAIEKEIPSEYWRTQKAVA